MTTNFDHKAFLVIVSCLLSEFALYSFWYQLAINSNERQSTAPTGRSFGEPMIFYCCRITERQKCNCLAHYSAVTERNTLQGDVFNVIAT